MNNKGKIAVSEIMILLIGFVAMVYFIGIPFVSGKPDIPFVNKNVPNPRDIQGALATPGGSSRLSGWLGVKERASGTDSFINYQTGGIADAFFSGVQWYMVAYWTVKMVGPMLGWTDAKTGAAAKAAGWGFGVGRASYVILQSQSGLSSLAAGWTSFGIGAIIALYMYSKEYKETVYRVVDFDCKSWQADTKGKNCEDCNNQELPCSLYQCKSLGQACELLNQGTKEELCAWKDPKDVKYPVIEPDENALKEGYVYTPTGAVSPPDRGVEIVNTQTSDGCVPAFFPLKFGITLDEPARCKIDYFRKRSFEDMRFDFGGSSSSKYNHTQIMSLPSPNSSSSEQLIINNDGVETLYVKCEDANGNPNTANFVFKFCVEQSPDTTAPLIEDTSIINKMPVAFNQDTLDLTVYINEPAECKWSSEDKSYENMENQMTCIENTEDYVTKNAVNVYPCETTLTGLKNQQENKFYFRCKDQPLANNETERNTNTESYVYTILGTRELYIDNVGPNGTVRDSTESVKVTLTAETSAGYNEGEAMCRYRETGTDDIPVEFFNSASWQHSTELFLVEGDYTFDIICTDLGGNQDTVVIEFEVESDSDEPIVVRTYKETGYLKVVTNEKAQCVYDTKDCSYLYEDGIPMTTSAEDETSHLTEWNTKTKFYVKCQDEYGNKPVPNKCSAIIKPLD